ncbi:MAG: hypothetical protein E7408_00880 [Ruminococcaceae bacterium]|nr:hypothetical protein [Oscillospiraceae bacterium]
MDKALILEDLHLRVGGQQIFSELNMEVAPGEIVAVCGTSGSHMHAFVNLLTRTYEAPYTLSGRLLVDNAEIERLSDEEMRFARMMSVAVLPKIQQQHTLHMSVQKYILLPFKDIVKKTPHEILTDAKRIMKLLGVQDPERIFRQRMSSLHIKDFRAVLYAAALSTDPAVAVAFADGADLSPHEADELYALLIKVCKIKNISLLLLTGDISFARRYGEQVYIAKHDRIFRLDETVHPHLRYLEDAASMHSLALPLHGEDALLTAVNAVPVRGMQSLSFTLHKAEIIALPCTNGRPVFAGQRKPVSGKLCADSIAIHKHAAYKKGIMSVFSGMTPPPVSTCDQAVCTYAVRPSQRLSTDSLYMALGLPADYGKTALRPGNVYETLRLGLLCAAVAESRIILLSDIDLLSSAADRYDILMLLAAVCQRTGAGAIVFSGRTDILRAFGSDFGEPSPTVESTEELQSEVAGV